MFFRSHREIRSKPNTINKMKFKPKKAAELLEFAMASVIMFLFLAVIINLANIVMHQGMLDDALMTAAQQGAQLGGAGSASSGPSRSTYYSFMQGMPNGANNPLTFNVVTGSTCTVSSPNNFVTLNGTVTVPVVLPGIYHALHVFLGPNATAAGYVVSSTEVARCEVVG